MGQESTLKPRSLPWPEGKVPLMLAPMKGLTDRTLRALFIEWVRPDVVFTEFMPVSNVSRKQLTRKNLAEAASAVGNVPLVIQLSGNQPQALVTAACKAQAAGALHINYNLGCPFGRRHKGAIGGALLRHPELLSEIVPALRTAIKGSFSIKLRSGYDDPKQIYPLLSLFENSHVDFLVLHPRTVEQKYRGTADHSLTASIVKATSLPVIANGDIRSATQGIAILQTTRASGLMLGRGAISDPLLFQRLRNGSLHSPSEQDQATMIRRFLVEIVKRYEALYCGDEEVLGRVKNVLGFIDQRRLRKPLEQMKRARTLADLVHLIAALDSCREPS